MPVLDQRAINRATLERQLLLRRRDLAVPEAVELLLGLNAQNCDPPYLSLWSRLTGFRIDDLTRALYDRTVVSSAMMRSTLHMVGAADFPWLRPLVQPVLERAYNGAFGRAVSGLDTRDVLAFGRELLRQRPHSHKELRDLLAERWPDHDRSALVYTLHYLLPLVRVPPGGTWQRRGPVTSAPAESWLGCPLDPAPSHERLVMRYLAAFGPATAKDVRTWSGIPRMRAVLDGLRPRLRVFHDPEGAELFDLPEAPRPDPDTPAPVRFLPEFDNLLTAYADRGRVIPDEYRKRVCVGAWIAATVMVDGFVAGMWRVEHREGRAVLVVEPFAGFSADVTREVATEGRRLLEFVAPEAADHELRIG